MEPGPLHASVEPLKFLIGTWRSVSASGKFADRIGPFSYCEQLEFVSLGQPMLKYTSTSWHPEKKTPMHLESGFLKIKPGTRQLSFLVAHNFGLATVEEGEIVDRTIKLCTKDIGRSSISKDPAVTRIERTIEWQNDDRLKVVVCMATTETDVLTEHLCVTYERA